MSSEADACRKFVVTLLRAAGWDIEPHAIPEQQRDTDDGIIAAANLND